MERQPELDMIMEMTDPKLVYLVLDTGHATLGGIDPVKCLRDYYSRIAAIHLKDAEANTTRPTAGKVRRRAKRNTTGSISTSGSDLAAWTSRRSSKFCANAITTAGSRSISTHRRPGEGTVEQDMNSPQEVPARNASREFEKLITIYRALAMNCRTTASMSRSALNPSRSARLMSKAPGHVQTMRAIR